MPAFSEFTRRLKFVRWRDLVQVFPAIIGYLLSLVVRIRHNNVWLVCERGSDARDNGYWFFKYLCENHPEIEAVYAIEQNSVDYRKVASLGRVISFGSFTHWVYYWLAKRNVSSAKEGKPNAALCFLFEVYMGARRNRAYIRHGICKDDQKWVYYDVTKMNLFICSAEREYDFVSAKFGYPEGFVQLTGLCRFDNLLTPHEVRRQILVMPTMREWLRVPSSDTLKYEKSLNFIESDYYMMWSSLLTSDRLCRLLEKYKIDLLFFPHASMQSYLRDFRSTNIHVKLADANRYEVQHLLMESALLITDYSSVYFDFAYMKKPILYYQFDYDKYRRGQYQEGYFSYIDDGFGHVLYDENSLISEIEKVLEGGLVMPREYQTRVDSFFAFHDTQNCERTYESILKMK